MFHVDGPVSVPKCVSLILENLTAYLSVEGGPIWMLLYLTAPSLSFCVCGNSLRRILEHVSLFYTCSHQHNKKFLVAPDTKHKMQVSSVLTEDHFMLSHDALGIVNC